MAYYKTDFEGEEAKYPSAREALNKAHNLQTHLKATRIALASTASRSQAIKTQAIQTSKQPTHRKDAPQQVAPKLTAVGTRTQNIDDETKSPTTGQMKSEILAVLRASGKVPKFRAGSERAESEDLDVAGEKWRPAGAV